MNYQRADIQEIMEVEFWDAERNLDENFVKRTLQYGTGQTSNLAQLFPWL